MLAISSPVLDALDQFLLGLQPVIQIVTVLRSASQKQLVGAMSDRLRDRMASRRERIASASQRHRSTVSRLRALRSPPIGKVTTDSAKMKSIGRFKHQHDLAHLQ
jgi:hypothetical protein